MSHPHTPHIPGHEADYHQKGNNSLKRQGMDKSCVCTDVMRACYTHPTSQIPEGLLLSLLGKHWLGMTKLWRHYVLVSPGVLRKTEGMNQYWSGERNIWNSATVELNNYSFCANCQLQVINFLNVTPVQTPEITKWCNGKLILRWLPQNRPNVAGVQLQLSLRIQTVQHETWPGWWLMKHTGSLYVMCQHNRTLCIFGSGDWGKTAA